jgi:hypothetical protein
MAGNVPWGVKVTLPAPAVEEETLTLATPSARDCRGSPAGDMEVAVSCPNVEVTAMLSTVEG